MRSFRNEPLIPAFLVVLAFASASFAQEYRPPAEEVTIRNLDQVVRTNGTVEELEILSPNPVVGQTLNVRIRTIVTDLKPEDYTAIFLRRSPSEAYKNWRRWLRREFRGTTEGDKRPRDERARAEFELATWCRSPHPDLGGEPPANEHVLEHLIKAVRADPSFTKAWPHVVAECSVRHPVEEADLAKLSEEVDLYFVAEAAGFRAPEMDLRIARLLIERLAMPEHGVSYLQRVLRDPAEGGTANAGQRRYARSALARTYARLGLDNEALALYAEDLEGDSANDAQFNALWESADILLRVGGAENLALAQARLLEAATLQPDFSEIELRLAAIDYALGEYDSAEKRLKSYASQNSRSTAAKVDLAIIDIAKGRFSKAEKALKAALGSGPAYETAARANVALGSIAELRGELRVAETYFERALTADPEHVNARLLLAGVQIRRGDATGARTHLTSVLSRHAESSPVFGACSRLLAFVEARSEDWSKASARLEFAADVEPKNPSVLESTGLAFLQQGKLARGFNYLSRAHAEDPKRPATLGGLGFYHYQRGHHAEAAKFFDEAIAILKKAPKEGAEAAFSTSLRNYVTASRNLIRDLAILQVWVDEFNNTDDIAVDETLIKGWDSDVRNGISIKQRESAVVFEGAQANAVDGETELLLQRNYRSSDVERFSATLRIDSGRVSPVVHLGGPRNSRYQYVALEVFRDYDGKAKFRVRNSRGDWQEFEATSEDDVPEGVQKSNPLIYGGGLPWADDGKFRTIEVRRSRTKRNESKRNLFDIFLDGESLAQNVSVPGLPTEYEFAIRTRTDALDNQFKVTVDNFKIFRINSRALSAEKKRSRTRSR